MTHTLRETRLAKLSICPCGFPVLDDAITVGWPYLVDPEDTATFLYVCGGCGKEQHIVGIWVEGGGADAQGGFLPHGLFDL